MQGFGPNPQQINCQQCKKDVMTVVDSKSTDNNTLIGVILCLFGCWPCAIYMCACAEGTNEKTHSCPTCGIQFGTFKEQ